MSLAAESTCRVCLRDDGKLIRKFRSLFDEHKGRLISEKICLIADIKIQKGDELPNRICPKCLVALNTAYNFKLLCEKSNNLIGNWLKKVNLHKLELSNAEIEPYIQKQESKIENKVEFRYDVNIDTIEIKQETETQDIEPQQEPRFEQMEESDLTLRDIYTKFVKHERSDAYQVIPNYQDQFNDKKERFKVRKAVNIKIEPHNIRPDKVNYTTAGKKTKAIDLHVECDDCGENFKSKCKLSVHWKKVHMPERLTCTICKRKFTSYRAYNKHEKMSTTCIVALSTDIEGSGKNRVFHCKKCSYSSKRLSDMRYHLNCHTGQRPYICKLCNKGFTQHSALQGHLEGTHKIYKAEMACPYCGKFIKGRHKIYTHLKQHNPDKLQCDICKKFLQSRTSLIEHFQIHEGNKNFVCEKCPAAFNTKTSLYNHKRNVHGSKCKAFECDLCGYKTNLKKTLKAHRVRHTGTNFACTVCGSFHVSIEKLAMHQRRHFSERNYECLQCGKKFMTQDNLGKHVRSIHKLSLISNKTFHSTKKIQKTDYVTE